MTPPTRFHYFLLGAALFLIVLAIMHQRGDVEGLRWPSAGSAVDAGKSQTGSESQVQQPPPSRPSFHEIALKYGTDKVTTHHYWFMYDKYLPIVREKRVKMLEIGLGCDMYYGPGKSYYTWLEYFPNVDLYYMEYDADCAAKWAAKVEGATIEAGDQADEVFLNKFMADHGTDFDIIIDDGGHTMVQQMKSLQHLWKAVKPGGIYFIEDLQTSFMPVFGGDPDAQEAGKFTTMRYIYELIVDKMTDRHDFAEISADIRSIDCDREICALIKKEEGTV